MFADGFLSLPYFFRRSFTSSCFVFFFFCLLYFAIYFIFSVTPSEPTLSLSFFRGATILSLSLSPPSDYISPLDHFCSSTHEIASNENVCNVIRSKKQKRKEIPFSLFHLPRAPTLSLYATERVCSSWGKNAHSSNFHFYHSLANYPGNHFSRYTIYV